MSVKSIEDLIAWQKAMDFVVEVYHSTRNWPREELYGLTSQLRRSAVSVPSNIAEGQGRFSTKEFLNHLSISYGSLTESFTQIKIARRLNYLEEEQSAELASRADEVGRIINGLARKLEAKIDEPAGRGKRRRTGE
ncbi:MAG: four helix bundle protein [Planctomycetes bacterium]|nr:four helix bundle protein [Planctomycetota bacterium]